MPNRKTGKVIAIVGPHYSGKSSLAKRLAREKGMTMIEENWVEDPFQNFRSRGDYLKSQIWFLCECLKVMLKADALRQQGKKVVLDTFYYTTLAFCRSKLNAPDLKVFTQLFKAITKNMPQPNLLIFLNAPSQTLLDRARERSKFGSGPKSDAQVDEAWIKRTRGANLSVFSHWTKTPLVRVDVSQVDLKEHDSYLALLRQIKKYV